MVFVRPIQRVLFRTSHFRSHFHTSHCLRLANKAIRTFKLADIGEGITECEVIRWAVKEQSLIQSFELLCEVQSDKASVEITSPYDGVVKQLLVSEGEVAKVGQGLCLIEVEEEDEGTDEASKETSTPLELPVQSPPQVLSDAHRVTQTETYQPDPVTPQRKHPLDPTNDASHTIVLPDHVLATPSVRHFARELGVDLAAIAPGSGRDGRVERKDVEAFITRTSTSKEPRPVPTSGEDVVIDLGRTRYGMWKAMVQSLEIPRFGYSTSLDLTRLHAILPTLNAYIPAHYLPASSTQSPSRISQMVNPSALYPAPQPHAIPESGKFTKMTYLPFLLKTLATSMMEWPLFRASLTSTPSKDTNAKPTLTIRPTADLTLALSTPTGLYTPTISSTQSLSLHALASRISHLAYLGRQVPCALTQKDMPKRGGTVSVSNVGAIGKGEGASPVLIPGGGVAIVAIGRAKWVWDVSNEFYSPEDGLLGERRLKIDVSWSADHRVVEGAELAAFVETWRGWVENPERLIAEAV
ncbi:2-oxoacid dehydrogenases acyltransferase-domain-containing protein [Scleroderma yunnanense]